VIRESDFEHLPRERGRDHVAWANGVLERLGPRPETRLVHVRAGSDPVPRTFEEFVGGMLTRTPDEAILLTWPTWPLLDPGSTVAE